MRQWLSAYCRDAVGMMIVLTVFLMLGSCVKNEFVMEFRLPESVNSTYRLSYYASDPRGGLQVESAVAVAGGKADVTGITRYPTLVTISHGVSYLPAAIFYAERGDKITISGQNADPLGWEISGNSTNTLLTTWRLTHRKAIEEARRSTPGDTVGAKVRRELNALVEKFVKENPESAASPLLLFTYFDAALQPALFNSLRESLREKGLTDEMTALLSRQDVSGAPIMTPDPKKMRLNDMTVQSADNNCDTLRFAEASAPVMLCYWRRADEKRKEMIDSLRRLEKWRPDSASMVIADVALTPDSAQWRSSLRLDSLSHTIRAYSPRGMADSCAMLLGVRSTPWFVVGAGKGRLLYSGPDLAEATRIFRSTRPKKITQ